MKQYLIVLATCMLVIQAYGQQYGSFTDARDGRVYKTVKIGNQEWMAENLNVVTFRNGDPIPQAATDEEWIKAAREEKPAWCYFGNNPENGIKYGRLYNWYAVNDPRGLSPIGFHIPKDAEIDRLNSHITEQFPYGPKSDDIFSISSVKLLSKKGWDSILNEDKKDIDNKDRQGSIFWDPLNIGIEKKYFGSTGFEALPSGRRYFFRSYETISFDWDYGTSWWGVSDYRSTKRDTRLCMPVVELDTILCQFKENAINYRLNFATSFLFIDFQDKGTGSYVRCIKD